MSKSDACAKKLYGISDERIYDDRSPVEEIFSSVKIIDGKIYIICSVFDRWGESYAAVFEYDFETEQVKFVTSEYVSNMVLYNFDIVING